MGIFPSTSKKASVTLVFLIVSILVISSGAVIVHEIKKTNGGVTETGLVLLDEVQHVEEEQVDNFEEDVVDNSYSFVVIHDKISSSKTSDKSHKSKSSKDLGKSEKSSGDDLEYLSFDLKNNTFWKDTSNFQNEELEGESLNNELNSSNNTKKSESEIFTKNNITYIIRDDEKYMLTKSGEIAFNPPLPSSVCVGEIMDIKLDLGTVDLKWGTLNEDYLSCKFNGQKDVSVKYCLMEHDFWSSDDEIKCGYGTATTYDCTTLNLENFRGYLVKREFTDIKLSDQFTGLDANSIEVYAKVSNYNNYFYAISTQDYKIKKETTCQCISGSCCDLSSRPYTFKSYGSQPTNHEDYYTCDGTNSPTGISYAKFIDWYCSGNYKEAYLHETYTDTCGLCAYCKQGYSSCFFYYQNEYCGTKDCDYLDVTCRDYHDVNRGCSGGGICSNPSCNSYTDADKGTSCGTNKECDGNGNCVSACECSSGPCCDGCNYKTSGAQPTGYTDDTNGFCTGTEGATSTSYVYTRNYYCNGLDADQHYTDTKRDTCGTCEYCTNNDLTCNYYSSSTICSSLRDCDYLNNYHITGTQGATSTSYCKYADYNDNYRYCNGAGSCFSLTCLLSSDTITATAGTCKYISGCSGSTSGTVKNYASGTSCGTNKECDGNGNCLTVNIRCSSDSDCGTDGWTGSAFCSGDDVYQDYRTWTCNDAGTTSSTCSYVDTTTLKQDCGEDYCEDWGDNYCYDNDEYHSRTCHEKGCSSGACLDSAYVDKQKVQECGTAGCSNGVCNIVCFNDGDCGTDGWTGSAFCSSENIHQKWRTYTCNNAGTVDAFCSYTDKSQLKQDCGEDCYIGNTFCKDNNVWQTWRNYMCTNSATQGVSCSYTNQTKMKEDCGGFSCSSWGTNYCKEENVYHKRTCSYGGCSNGICHNNLNAEEQEEVVQTCENGCTEGRCKVEVCETVCTLIKCYEYCVWQ